MHSSGYSVQTPQSGRHPRGKKRKLLDMHSEEILCSTCDIWVKGVPQYQSHLLGTRHLRKEKERSADQIINRMPFMKTNQGEGLYTCELCDITLNSALVAMVHVDGIRHKSNVEAYEIERGEVITYGEEEEPSPTSGNVSSNGYYFNPAKSISNGSQEDREREILEEVAKKMTPVNFRDAAYKVFECKLCEIETNSEVQLQQHMMSSKHNNNLINTRQLSATDAVKKQYLGSNVDRNNQIGPWSSSTASRVPQAPPPPRLQPSQTSAMKAPPQTPANKLRPILKNNTSSPAQQNNSASTTNNETPIKNEKNERELEEIAKTLVPVSLGNAVGHLVVYECKVCDIRANSEAQLVQHKESAKHKHRETHPGEKVPWKTKGFKTFQCPNCDKQLNSQVQMDQHMDVKHKIKPPGGAKGS